MPESDQLLAEPEYAHLTRVLADFAAWLTPPWIDDHDQAHYHDLAARFLQQRGATRMVDPPRADAGQCDLCGLPFRSSGLGRTETLTGDNYLWCSECLAQQRHVYRILGPKTYRDAWRRQLEAHAHVDR